MIKFRLFLIKGSLLAAAVLGVGLAQSTTAQAKAKTQTMPKSLRGHWAFDFGDMDVSCHITAHTIDYYTEKDKLGKKVTNKTFTLSKKPDKKGYWTIKTHYFGTAKRPSIFKYKRIKNHLHVIIVRSVMLTGWKKFNYRNANQEFHVSRVVNYGD